MQKSGRRKWLTGASLALLIVLLAAAFFRLWQIGGVPPGLFGDEATDGLDALDVLAGRGAVFFPANFGREGLHIWIVAGFFKLLGVSALAVRLPSAIAGIATALATLWLGVEITRSGLSWLAPLPDASGQASPAGRDRWPNAKAPAQAAKSRLFAGPSVAGLAPVALGLVAALYLSTSYFHVHFSRFGIRGVFTPLCAALAFAAFWRGVNTRFAPASLPAVADDPLGSNRSTAYPISQSPNLPSPNLQSPILRSPYLWFAFSGLFLGLSLHFYTASRFLPLFLAGFLALQAVISLVRRCPAEAILFRLFGPVALLFAVAAAVFAPLGLYFIQHPGSFMQRASEVSAFKEGTNAWALMGQAGLANVLQFFLPGFGDTALFYNWPGRPVFDPLTALLAVAGIGVLLWRWKQPAALFLLTWWPALLLPSILATDRFPTLPRVLGALPGVYFFPAAALLALAGLWQRSRGADSLTQPSGQPRRRAQKAGAAYGLALPAAGIAAALLVHGSLTFNDYFLSWGRAVETYEAFEADMTQAVGLLTPRPASHVYLSSDIYRHPTFMLLGQGTPVSRYFEDSDPNLSWFDGRSALPLPPEGQPAVYVVPTALRQAPQVTAFLFNVGARRVRRMPPGVPELMVGSDLPATAKLLQPDRPPEPFSDRLSLVGATWAGPPIAPTLRLFWQTTGPDPAGWNGYRLQIDGQNANGTTWQVEKPFDDFRPPEWVPGGRFITWRELELPQDTPALPSQVRLRLIDVASGLPLLAPGADPREEGWHTLAVNRQ